MEEKEEVEEKEKVGNSVRELRIVGKIYSLPPRAPLPSDWTATRAVKGCPVELLSAFLL